MRKSLLLLMSCLILAACNKTPPASSEKPVDVLLIGAGTMSATLGSMLEELDPSLTMEMVARLDSVAAESSDAMNNAGTGHSAFAELNYTPEAADGSIETKKAVAINEQFEISKQFWAYQVANKHLGAPQTFINNVPHMAFVWGDDNISFLKKRYAALQKENLFKGMLFSEDQAQIEQWARSQQGRDKGPKVAATAESYRRQFRQPHARSREYLLQPRHTCTCATRWQTSTRARRVERDGDRLAAARKNLRAKFVFMGGACGGCWRC